MTKTSRRRDQRDPERALPRLDAPALAELGLAQLASTRRRTQVLFLVRPLVAAGTVTVATTAGMVPLALIATAVLYASTLTLVHHTIHSSLDLPRTWRNSILALAGALALNSGRALEATHLQHHRTDPQCDDPEGRIESVPWRRLPLEAFLFRYRLWWWAWHHGRRRRWIEAEAILHVATLTAGLAIAAGTGSGPWLVTIGALWAADVAFAVLAGKGPQTNWGRPLPTPLVAVRCRLSRVLLVSHNYHLEHHLYPNLPLPYLGPVAAELDRRRSLGPIVTIRLP
jgi:beta-carotene hydroxylase